MSKVNLIGKQFGHLTVVAKSDKRGKNREVYWTCQCDCGKVIKATTGNLKGHRTLSCGHWRKERMSKYALSHARELHLQKLNDKPSLDNKTGFKNISTYYYKNKKRFKIAIAYNNKRYSTSAISLRDAITKREKLRSKYWPNYKAQSVAMVLKQKEENDKKTLQVKKTHRQDLTGKKYGCLTVIGKSKRRGKYGDYYWICRCSCGNMTEAKTSDLNNGNVKSCGHLKHEKRSASQIRKMQATRMKGKASPNSKTGFKNIHLYHTSRYQVELAYNKKRHTALANTIKDAIAKREKLRAKYWPNYQAKSVDDVLKEEGN